MAARTLNTVVLCGANVAPNSMAFGTNRDTSAAMMQSPALPFSARHQSLGCQPIAVEPDRRPDRLAGNEVDSAAKRAGRPGSRAGVLGRRSPARNAGGTVRYRWSPGGCGPITKAHPERSQASATWQLANGSTLCLPFAAKASKCVEVLPTGLRPVGRTPSASTRGKGD